MQEAFWKKVDLQFTSPRRTSRAVMLTKPSYFIVLKNTENNAVGIGECGLLPGLSHDDKPEYEAVLDAVVKAYETTDSIPHLGDWPSIGFGFEMALKHLSNGDFSRLFDTPFSHGESGIEINGLVWMNPYKTMLAELKSKIETGFTCIKLKIGAVDFEDELKLIQLIRKEFSSSEITIRVDANGAFSPKEAPQKLDKLAKLDIHSIEQPIKAGQWLEMEKLCKNTPIPIALDEELIGLNTHEERTEMMTAIKPQAIILKPSLIGGFAVCDEWISLCAENSAFWWATSALESNIGLNAIAQYAASKNPGLAQGLGTGMLYSNNIPSPLEIRKNKLFYNSNSSWSIPFLQ